MSQSNFVYGCKSLRIEHDPENENALELHVETDHGPITYRLYGLSDGAILQAFGGFPPQAGDAEAVHA